MKKYILAMVLGMSVMSVHAATDGKNFGKIEYAFRDIDGDHANKNGINLTLGREFAPGIKLDAKFEYRNDNSSDQVSYRTEVGAAFERTILPSTKAFVRTAVGKKFNDGNGDDYGYYSIEPGIKYALNNRWAINTSYRFRDTFRNNTAEETHRGKIGVEYALTKTTTVNVDVARYWGDRQYNGINVGYGFKF
jgi:opacity protein-like surface antigen